MSTISFQWIKINKNQVTMSDYMNPKACRIVFHLVPCKTRINMVKEFPPSIL